MPEIKIRGVVAVGVSLGGLDALTEILKPLPAHLPACILVAMHIAPDWESYLAEVLDKRTALSVQQATGGESIRAGNVFIAPPAHHLVVTEVETLRLSTAPKVHFARPSADPLFTSVASVYKERAIGVVLTGGDGDGSAGVRAIREAGGRTIAQDEDSSQNSEMPRHAADTGCIDQILPLGQIGPAILALVRQSI